MTHLLEDDGTEPRGYHRRCEDPGSLWSDDRVGPIRLDLQEIERDAAGIPTFVFHDRLREGDQPSAAHKTLEVSLLWREALMSVGHYEEARRITIGDSLRNDFRVSAEGLPGDRYVLLDNDHGEFVVSWIDTMSVEVRNEAGEILGFEQLNARGLTRSSRDAAGRTHYRYRLALHDRVAVQVDQVTFVLQYVSPASLVSSGVLGALDYYFVKVAGLSAVAHLFLVMALLLTPMDPMSLSEDLFSRQDRFARLILQEPPRRKKQDKFDLAGVRAGARAKQKQGKFGRTEPDTKDTAPSAPGAPRVDPDKQERDRRVALRSGLFAALDGGLPDTASNVFGTGGLGTGINTALGGLRASGPGDVGGAGGLGSRGGGLGGGGSSLGIGGLGNGRGRVGGGVASLDLGGRGRGRHRVLVGRTVTKGCMTGQAVMRVLQRVRSQARYCYEKELTREPTLEGKVTTSFVIGPTGAVQLAQILESTMNNAGVEECLLRILRRLRFPPCAGGGTAEVTYPWIFKAGGN